jgi:hypothetical protein
MAELDSESTDKSVFIYFVPMHLGKLYAGKAISIIEN